MKRKLLLTVPLLILSGILGAQNLIHQIKPDVQETNRQKEPRTGIASSAALVSEWFNYGDLLYLTQDPPPEDVRVDLFPDSTVLIDYGDYMDNPWRHSVGQVIDPTAQLFAENYTPINEFTPYHVDSIAFPYRYFRFQDAAPDTLLIQYYNRSKMAYGTAGGASFATVAYDTATHKGADPVHEFTYLLTNADTARLLSYLSFPVDMDIVQGGEFAATITYFPGNPYSFGDTLDPYITPPPTNRINSFAVFEYKDYDRVLEPGIYNHSLDATTPVLYGTSSWEEVYVPGIGWVGYVYHMDMYFLLIYAEPSSVEKVSEEQAVVVYPNPVTQDLLNISMPGHKGKVEYTLINSLGQVVAVGVIQNPRTTINTYGLKPGLYLLNLLIDGELVSKKVKKS